MSDPRIISPDERRAWREDAESITAIIRRHDALLNHADAMDEERGRMDKRDAEQKALIRDLAAALSEFECSCYGGEADCEMCHALASVPEELRR